MMVGPSTVHNCPFTGIDTFFLESWSTVMHNDVIQGGDDRPYDHLVADLEIYSIPFSIYH